MQLIFLLLRDHDAHTTTIHIMLLIIIDDYTPLIVLNKFVSYEWVNDRHSAINLTTNDQSKQDLWSNYSYSMIQSILSE